MFSNSIRLILFIICFLFASYQFFEGDFYYGFLLLIAALFLFYGYFRYGSVWYAFQSLAKGDIDKTEVLINSTKYPNLLSKQQKAYFYFAKAVIEQNKNHLDAAETFYLNSLTLGLRTTNDTSIVNLNLAQIYYQRGLLDAAKSRLRTASELSHKESVDIDIKILEDQLEA